MSRRLAGGAALAAALLATGCASHPQAAPSPPARSAAQSASSSPAVASGLSSPSAIAARIPGCARYRDASAGLYVRAEGYCKLHGKNVTELTFGSRATQRSWMRGASAFGAIFVAGKLWAVAIHTQADAEYVQRQLGGTIH